MRLLILALFTGAFCFASPSPGVKYPETNRPDLVRPLLDLFIVEARARGLEVNERLGNITSIMIVESPKYQGEEANGVTWTHGVKHRIELRRAAMETDGEAFRLFFHELGHAFGLDDCCLCTYNFMRCQESPRASMLFKDIKLREVYFDVFFEAIRNPRAYNGAHTHY